MSATDAPMQPQHDLDAEFEQLVRIFRKVAQADYSEKPDIPDSAIEDGTPLTQVSVALRFMIDDLEHSHQEQEKSRQLLQEERARLVSSINSIALGFAIMDRRGTVVLANKVLEKLLGNIRPASFSNIATAFRTSLDLEKYYQRVVATGSSFDRHEVEYNSRFFHIYLAPIHVSDKGTVIGATMLLEDITEAKLLERSRDEFFSIASHELRTPLTAIRGNASIINDYYLDAMDNKELRSLIGDIHESSVRLIAIVNDFLEASRLEQGKMVFQLAPFSIDDVIREVVHDMKHLLAEKQINLVFASDETTEPLTVWADAERTKQIIYNLVGNAEKFTHHGSITIHIEPTPHTVKILVSDTGSGISPENQHLLFHKFQQASNSLWTRDSSKGTGLGLYISKLLAESMDGHMQLECSELGQGSTFSFTLPLATSRQLDIKSEPANT